MKKTLSLIIVAALLAQSADVSAMDTARQYLGRGRAAVGRGAQSARAAFGQYVGAPMQAQGAKLATWAGPFLSEVGNAIQTRNFQALPGIVRKYKAQSGAAGAALVAVVAGIVALLTRRGVVAQAYADLSSKAASVGRRYGVDLEDQMNRDLLNFVERSNLGVLYKFVELQKNMGQKGKNIVSFEAIKAAETLTTDVDILLLLDNLRALLAGSQFKMPSELK